MVKDNGNGGYLVPKPLVHWAIISILGGLLTLGGYMVVWNTDDKAWKAKMEERWSNHLAYHANQRRMQ